MLLGAFYHSVCFDNNIMFWRWDSAFGVRVEKSKPNRSISMHACTVIGVHMCGTRARNMHGGGGSGGGGGGGGGGWWVVVVGVAVVVVVGRGRGGGGGDGHSGRLTCTRISVDI
jgi:hypothetical protein